MILVMMVIVMMALMVAQTRNFFTFSIHNKTQPPGAEMHGNEVDVANLSLRLQELTSREVEMSQNLEDWRERNGKVMEEARARLEKAETELDDLEASQGKHELDTDAEMALLEKIKLKHEQLEAERKVFEDLEFHKMEEEAQLEAEMEEVSMLMNTTQKELDTAETVVSEMELQKAEITINQDVSILQVQNLGTTIFEVFGIGRNEQNYWSIITINQNVSKLQDQNES